MVLNYTIKLLMHRLRFCWLVLCCSLAACTETPAPDNTSVILPASHVFRNGFIYTADAARNVAEAVAVRDDKIIYVGADAGAAQLIGDRTQIHDLNGNMVLPGLHDVHIHVLGLIQPEVCDLHSNPLPLAVLVDFLRACMQQYPVRDDGWFTVEQWSFAVGNQPDDDFPTLRAALDAVSEEVPIMLLGNDGHHAAVNSAALAQATANGETVGLNSTTLNRHFASYREYIGVDQNGEPDGALSEDARFLVQAPAPDDYDVGPERISEAARVLAAAGLTTVQDADMRPDDLPLFEYLAASGDMSFRLYAALHPDFAGYRAAADGGIDIAAIMTTLTGIRARFSNHPTIRTPSAKIYVDGVLEGNPYAEPPTLPNAAVLKPYRQPRFVVDRATGELAIAGYVDMDSPPCRQVRASPASYNTPEAMRAFREKHGYSPRQCAVSRGVLEHDRGFIRDYMQALHENGFIIHAHAIGDRAVRLATDVFADLRRRFGARDLPHLIAHAQLVHPDDQRRLGEMGTAIAFTYAWAAADFAYDMTVTPFIVQLASTAELYNADNYVMKNAYPARSLQQFGALLVAGSDAPVDTRDPRPFVNMAVAVTRRLDDGRALNSMQGISIEDAIAAYTLNGARALQCEMLSGSIEVGKKADLIVIDQNIVKLAAAGAAQKIAETKVLTTMFDGNIVYSADAQPGGVK